MVAEVSKPSFKRRGLKPGTSLPKIDLFTRSQAHNLYVVRQLGAEEVATQTGLSKKQVYQLAQREGWTKTRILMKDKAEQALRARESEDIEELVDAVASKSKVLSLGTLDAAIAELKHGGEFQAKNLQALSVASTNFVKLYRQAKELDKPSEQSNQHSTLNVMFVGSLPQASAAQRSVKDVTPAQ